MKSDSAFYIGTTHEVCEDYAVSGDDFIIVSDGCSSSPKTDVGSRIACEVAVKYNAYKFPKLVLSPLTSKMAGLIGLPDHAMDVTFLSAHIEEEKVIIQMIGDGNIIIKSKDGTMYVISAEYSRSAPYYISYMSSPENDKLWDGIPGNFYEIDYTIMDGGEPRTYKQDMNCSFNEKTFIPNSEFYFGPKMNRIVLDIKDVDWMALSSDGLRSFYEQIETETSSYSKSVPYLEVVKELFKIKNNNGRFIQRRLNKFRKACARKNWHNGDDISLAVMSMEIENATENT